MEEKRESAKPPVSTISVIYFAMNHDATVSFYKQLNDSVERANTSKTVI